MPAAFLARPDKVPGWFVTCLVSRPHAGRQNDQFPARANAAARVVECPWGTEAYGPSANLW